jgi:hypothetical protein
LHPLKEEDDQDLQVEAHLQDNPRVEDHPLDHQEEAVDHPQEAVDHPQEDRQEDWHQYQQPWQPQIFQAYRMARSKELCPPHLMATEPKQINLYGSLDSTEWSTSIT